METYRTYSCNKCGACCRNVDKVNGMQMYDRGDGTCIHLQENNRCEIYPTRPSICNGKYVYEHYFSHISVDEFHNIVHSICKKLQEENTSEGLCKDKSHNRYEAG